MQTFIKLLKLARLSLFIAIGSACASDYNMDCQIEKGGLTDYKSDCLVDYTYQTHDMETIFVDSRHDIPVNRGQQNILDIHRIAKHKLVDFYEIESEIEQRDLFNKLEKKITDFCMLPSGLSLSPDVCFHFMRVQCIESTCGFWVIYKYDRLVSRIRIDQVNSHGIASIKLDIFDDESIMEAVPSRILSEILNSIIPYINKIQKVSEENKINFMKEYFMAVRYLTIETSPETEESYDKRNNLEELISFFKRYLNDKDALCLKKPSLCTNFNKITSSEEGIPALLHDIRFHGLILEIELDIDSIDDETLTTHFNKVGMYSYQENPNIFYWPMK